MSKIVRVLLTEPMPGHNGPINHVVLREPTYAEYVDCGGEPYSYGQSEEGVIYSTEKPDVIWAYVEACIVEPTSPLLLQNASWRDAREVRKAILGFFRDPVEAKETSGTSPTTSPSNSINPSTPSNV